MKYVLWLVSLLMIVGTAMAADAPAGQPPAPVAVATVQEQMVAENTPIVGTLYFDTVSNVSTEVSGLVQSIPFKAGDRVKKGDILVRLNTDFLDKNIDLAVSRVEQVDVAIEKVGKNLQRYEALFRKEAASQKTYDDLRYSRDELCKQRDALAKELEIARLKKAKSTVRAPFDGIVLEKCAEVGNWVSPGLMVCRLGALNELCVKVPIAEELMTYSHENAAIQVTLTALQKTVEGTVAGFLPVADLKTKNVMVKIRLPRMPRVVENMSATVLIPTTPPKKLTLVPRDAIVNLQGRDFVYTVKEGKAVPIPVKVVAFIGEYAGVDSPLVADGMRVIVDGGERLRPDQPVQIITGK